MSELVVCKGCGRRVVDSAVRVVRAQPYCPACAPAAEEQLRAEEAARRESERHKREKARAEAEARSRQEAAERARAVVGAAPGATPAELESFDQRQARLRAAQDAEDQAQLAAGDNGPLLRELKAVHLELVGIHKWVLFWGVLSVIGLILALIAFFARLS